ncbi:MAG TPA: hypothetical protein VK791_02105 [bacterium]|nr:hypothetical protein [bacterium]
MNNRSSSPIYSNPWFYGVILTISNILLSYITLSESIRLGIILFGWITPAFFGFYFFSKKAEENPPLNTQESLPAITKGTWALIIFLALLPRFYLLLNNYWPVSDEGLFTFLSLELSKKWQWIIFFSNSQSPPIFNWVGAIYFYLFTPSILKIRLVLLFLALITAIFGYLIARRLFSKSMLFFTFLAFSFGFYSLYTYKYFLGVPVVVVFELIALYFLVKFLTSDLRETHFTTGWQLGLITALGFWMAVQWPLVAFVVAITVVLKFKKKSLTFYGFWAPAFLSFSLFVIASVLGKNGQHISEILSLPAPGAWQERVTDSLDNWTSLFWGCDIKNSYGPVWGGMLNPICGGLFLIGSFELVRYRKNRFFMWLLSVFFIFMIPGIITNTFEIFRNSLTLPLVLVICALGLQSIALQTPRKWRIPALTVLLIASTSLDMTHLWKTYQPGPKAGSNYAVNSPQYSKAFDVLKETSRQKGPGYLFWGFNNNIEDPTLDVLTYSFNASENTKFSQENIQWGAFITNANYKPFLLDIYPMAKFYWLGPDDLWNQGGFVLVVIESKEKNWSRFKSWDKFNAQLHSVTNDYLLCPFANKEVSNFGNFLGTENLAANDRFLESVFYEKLIYFQRHNPHPAQFAAWINQAVHKGYPAAHLLVTEGLLLRVEGNNSGAKKLFEAALHSRLNLTDAQKNLAVLESLKKTR